MSALVLLASNGGLYIGGLLGFVLWIVVMVWIYNIAKRKGRHAVGWLILGFFFSLLSLIVLAIAALETDHGPTDVSRLVRRADRPTELPVQTVVGMRSVAPVALGRRRRRGRRARRCLGVVDRLVGAERTDQCPRPAQVGPGHGREEVVFDLGVEPPDHEAGHQAPAQVPRRQDLATEVVQVRQWSAARASRRDW